MVRGQRLSEESAVLEASPKAHEANVEHGTIQEARQRYIRLSVADKEGQYFIVAGVEHVAVADPMAPETVMPC